MVGGTKRPPQDSESEPWSHEPSNTKSNSNTKTKTFHEEESQNPSRVHVSLDNADTVIEGGPPELGLLGWGSSRRVRIHWYEAHGVGAKEQKINGIVE